MTGADADNPAMATAASATAARLGVWTHLAGVYDAAEQRLRLYVNGAEQPSPATLTGGFNAGGVFVVGRARLGGVAAGFFNGVVADVRAYDRVVYPAQIADLAAPALVGQWGFDEGTGSTTVDATGRQRLTLTGAATMAGSGRHGTAALRLDGASGSATTAGPVLHTDQSFTVSAWARLTGTATSVTAVGQDGNRMSGLFLQYSRTDNRWVLGRPTGDTDNAAVVRAVSTGPPELGTWTHLVGVYDAQAAEIRLYVNGALSGTASYAPIWNTYLLASLPDVMTPDASVAWALERIPLSRDAALAVAQARRERYLAADESFFAPVGVSYEPASEEPDPAASALRGIDRILSALPWVAGHVLNPRVRREVQAWLAIEGQL